MPRCVAPRAERALRGDINLECRTRCDETTLMPERGEVVRPRIRSAGPVATARSRGPAARSARGSERSERQMRFPSRERRPEFARIPAGSERLPRDWSRSVPREGPPVTLMPRTALQPLAPAGLRPAPLAAPNAMNPGCAFRAANEGRNSTEFRPAVSGRREALLPAPLCSSSSADSRTGVLCATVPGAAALRATANRGRRARCNRSLPRACGPLRSRLRTK